MWTGRRTNDHGHLFLNWREEPCHGTTGTIEQRRRKTLPSEQPPLCGQAIHHGANRNLNHVTIIPCLAARGKHPIPYVATSQDLKSLRVDLQKGSIELERHFAVQGSQKACLNGKISADYIKSVFLPYVTKVRSERGIEQEDATSLMNNCLSHLSSDMMDMFTTAKVRMVVCARNATHIFQLLDLTLFVTFKWVGKHHLAFDDLMSTSRFIYRQE
jgi:hypothetical protein